MPGDFVTSTRWQGTLPLKRNGYVPFRSPLLWLALAAKPLLADHWYYQTYSSRSDAIQRRSYHLRLPTYNIHPSDFRREDRWNLHWMAEKPQHVLTLEILHLPLQSNPSRGSHTKWQSILHQKDKMATIGKDLHSRGFILQGWGWDRDFVPLDVNVGSNESKDFVEWSSDKCSVARKEMDNMSTQSMDIQWRIDKDRKREYLDNTTRRSVYPVEKGSFDYLEKGCTSEIGQRWKVY